ncbi:hypothetical protein AB0G74_01035 [Streptomyces sp. NPDC020875]|uniref:hypothetical protein n=1 Tax=Streptomyces sp. NPDC020875 TaxID=3154898 RepID=UPI0033CF4FBB
MKRIGITGHRIIPPEGYPDIRAAIRAVLGRHEGSLEAFSSLAIGADQLFADIALECGATLTAVIPSDDYEDAFAPGELVSYRDYRRRASREVRLGFRHSTDEAYYAAGAYIADNCDRLLAVWDGGPSRGLGGTADIVHYARDLGKPVTVIWRDGMSRP